MVRVRAPATSANLGSGFDVFGVALDRPADIITVERADTTSIEVTGAGATYIPTDPASNTAGVVASELDTPAHIHIEKGIRPASGLGSSAASAAGAAVALDALYGLGRSQKSLVRAAAKGERAVAGVAHADNVAPAVCGGFTAVTEQTLISVEAPIGLSLVAILPEQVVSTADARAAVPDTVTWDVLTDTVGNAATLLAGMYEADPDRIGQGMELDPASAARANLIEAYDAAAGAATAAGAHGVAVSGSGPAILAIPEAGASQTVAAAVVDAFEDAGIDARAFQTEIGPGATFLDKPSHSAT